MSNGPAMTEFPPPQILTYPASSAPVLIAQGAEGRLYKTTYLLPDQPCALKYRPSKPYRHPILDARLTRARILAEARVLQRCRREGVPVPAVYATNEKAGWLMMEWVDGAPVRQRINEWLGARPDTEAAQVEAQSADQTPLIGLMQRIGSAIGRLHRTGVVHGDLTTSNMILQRPKEHQHNGHTGGGAEGKGRALEGHVVLIDFGLATQSSSEEDRAVDLYVLERAFGSTHPRAEELFEQVLQSYKETFKQAPAVLRKLEDVRMRGRKRSMLG